MTKKLGFAAFLATTFLASTALSADAVDSRFKDYQSTSGVSGTLKSIGSDSLNNLMTLWAEDFKKIYPGVKIEIEGKGSSTAPPALIAGTAQFGPMSRAMRPAEKDQFEAKYGYKPTEVRVAVDALAVFVLRRRDRGGEHEASGRMKGPTSADELAARAGQHPPGLRLRTRSAHHA